jgi:predicted MPP superfamily phosphohydrolase
MRSFGFTRGVGRSAPRSAGLEGRWFHKLLLLTNVPAGWPAWVVGSLVVIEVAMVAGLWWLVAGGVTALWLAAAQIGFASADAAVLLGLPRRRVSFGPVGPQLLLLQVPRAVTGLVALPCAAWGLAPGALWAVVLVNVGALVALVWGAFAEPLRLRLTAVSVDCGGSVADAVPIRVLHLSDLHVERWGQREDRVLELVRAAAPDLIVLTGDYVSLSCVDDPVAHVHARRLLAALSAPAGVFAVLGSPPVDRNSSRLFDGLSIRLLRDEVAIVQPGSAGRDSAHGAPGRPLALVGLDCTHQPDLDGARLAEIASRAPCGVFRVLLYHSPELALVAPEVGVDLYLCGHTHGGQVRLPLVGALITSSQLGKRFEMGHHRIGRTRLYVSRGIGLEGMGAPRVRFLCPPEMTLFTLSGVPPAL